MRPTSAARRHFRPDIEGLRAVAILAVLGYHSGVPGMSGGFVGVDVFFVISGYLITGLLLRREGGSLLSSLAVFYARRARRLLPAALLVLAVTTVAARLVLPPIEWQRTAGDIAASALYVANIRFALQGSDYLDSTLSPSPVLHYWSLALEEQFYLLWPLLLLSAVLVARRFRVRPAVPATILLGALTIAGFGLCVALSQSDPVWGFFAPWSRAWQFGVGGLVALGRWRWLPGPGRQALALFGVAAIVLATAHAGNVTHYPGAWALVPTLGAAGVILAGTAAHPAENSWVGQLLARRPMTAVGRISYSWYLWHWPPLAIVAMVLGDWPWPLRLAVVLLSAIPAALSYRWVELPLRRPDGPLRGFRRPVAVGSLATAAVAAVSVWLLGVASLTAPVIPAADANASQTPAITPSGSRMRPQPVDARQDLPHTYRDGCHADIRTVSPGSCTFTAAGTRARATVVLFGDSHAAQWFPALHSAADARGWELVSMTKSGCPAAGVTVYNAVTRSPYAECDAFRTAALERIRVLRPDLVVVADHRRGYSAVDNSGSPRDMEPSRWNSAVTATVRSVAAAGARVALLTDTPQPGFDVPACLSRHMADPAACSVSRAEALDPTGPPPSGTAPAEIHNFTDLICGPVQCPPVVAGWLVYRDADHLTASFAKALGPAVGQAIADQLAAPQPPERAARTLTPR